MSGFIDLGDSGVADKWRDLALCFRSLRHNTDGTYGHVVPGLRAEKLFDHLGIAPDWDKLRYYILLDEFLKKRKKRGGRAASLLIKGGKPHVYPAQ